MVRYAIPRKADLACFEPVVKFKDQAARRHHSGRNGTDALVGPQKKTGEPTDPAAAGGENESPKREAGNHLSCV
jgi:hypothetical protein